VTDIGHQQRRASKLVVVLLLLGWLLVVLGASVGSTGFESVLKAWQDPLAQQIVWEIRLPRTLGAWAAGALLGLAGAVAQGLFRNPLADPFLLGSASGASLGVAIALVLLGVSPFAAGWLVRLGLTGAAFAGAVLAVALTLLLAQGVQHTLRLLLAGVIVGVVLGALTSLLMLLDPEVMQSMQAFMLGSTGFVGWTSWLLMVGAWTICIAGAWMLSPVLDGLSLGEATATSLGLPLVQMRVRHMSRCL
jgi:iron complex transport system permease protein